MRFERKYRIEGLSREEILSAVQQHALSFRTLFPDRKVNNIYLDTQDLQFFQDNLSGTGDRKKYRIRWYGNDWRSGDLPVREIKIKHNELGAKDSLQLEEHLPLDDIQALQQYVDRNAFGGFRLLPVLFNSYQRSYLTSYDQKFRVTIDWEMRFFGMEKGFFEPTPFMEDPAVIVEVKYDAVHDQDWKRFSEGFPFRVTKNSKYVNGMVLAGGAQ